VLGFTEDRLGAPQGNNGVTFPMRHAVRIAAILQV